jgi:regulator of protease activity HflC (stomatin/prohibitin superfamily)
LRVAIILVFIYLPFSGFFISKPTEQAMLFRFGKLVEKQVATGKEGNQKIDVLPAGDWYAAYPRPIDRVQRIPKDQTMNIVTYQFWPSKSKTSLYQESEGRKILKEDFKKIQIGRDGYLITGDQCIIHMIWSIDYQVSDPKCYYLNNYEANISAFNDFPGKMRESARGFSSDFHPLLQSLLEEAIMTEVALWSIDEIYANSRKKKDSEETEPITVAVEHRLKAMLKELDPGLGIKIARVDMVTKMAPLAIGDVFSEVDNARNQAETKKQEAKNKVAQDRNRVLNEAEQIKAAATVYQNRIISLMDAQKNIFLAVLPDYRKFGAPALEKRRSDALSEFYVSCGQKYVVHRRSDGTLDIRLLITPPPKPKPATDGEAPGSGR